ncbi:MAG: hypothetical protein BIFFINMI_04384 [Phycisphaerae bacterium]|nr:hypothetical protein [Phycisphaerae bacterium]
MSRVCVLGTLGVMLAGLGGCMFQSAPADKAIQVVLREVSDEHPVRVVLTVDGKKDWEGELGPHKQVVRVLHNPDPEAHVQLAPGRHRILIEIHKNYPWGKVGDGQVDVYSGEQRIYTCNSKWMMPFFRWWWDVELTVPEPVGGTTPPPSRTTPPPMGGTSTPGAGAGDMTPKIGS